MDYSKPLIFAKKPNITRVQIESITSLPKVQISSKGGAEQDNKEQVRVNGLPARPDYKWASFECENKEGLVG